MKISLALYGVEDDFLFVFLSCQDEEEFPGLTLALTGTDRLITSSNIAKLCNEVCAISYFSAQMFSHNNYNVFHSPRKLEVELSAFQ